MFSLFTNVSWKHHFCHISLLNRPERLESTSYVIVFHLVYRKKKHFGNTHGMPGMPKECRWFTCSMGPWNVGKMRSLLPNRCITWDFPHLWKGKSSEPNLHVLLQNVRFPILWHLSIFHLSHTKKKNAYDLHYTGWLIGTLVMVYYI